MKILVIIPCYNEEKNKVVIQITGCGTHLYLVMSRVRYAELRKTI